VSWDVVVSHSQPRVVPIREQGLAPSRGTARIVREGDLARAACAKDPLMLSTLTAALRDERGQGLAEYGLILGLVALLCIAAVLFMSSQIQGVLSATGSSI
jgi:pilus assembly protein Flp/PilA